MQLTKLISPKTHLFVFLNAHRFVLWIMNHARRIFGINYTTYASYLRRDVSQLSDRPEVAETVRRLDEILNK